MTEMDWNDLSKQSLPSLSGDGWATTQWTSTATGAPTDGTTMDAATLYTSTAPSTEAAATPAAAQSLEELLARHETSLLDKIVQQTEADTRQRTDALIEQQLQQAWEREREFWMQELVGNRTLGGAAASSVPGAGGHLQLAAGNGSSSVTTRPSATMTTPQRSWTLPSTMMTPDQPLDPAQVRSHLEVTKRMTTDPTQAQLQDTIDAFRYISETSATVSGQAYANTWLLVRQLTQARQASPVDQARFTVVHFCLQFQELVVTRVRQASLAGQDLSVLVQYENAMANQCSVYTKLAVGVTGSVWPVLYYCLRCGDAVAALQVWQQSGPTEASVTRVLTAMAQAQMDAACVWEVGIPRVAQDDCLAVLDLLERAKNAPPSSSNALQGAACCLMCGMDKLPLDNAIPGLDKIEDYLLGGLWVALRSPSPVDEVTRLGQVVQGYGEKYFDDNTSGGWSYALPLLATQQYQKALSYLTEAGGRTGLLQATHLALVLTSAGVAVTNLGQPDVGKDTMLTALLVEYSKVLLVDPTAGATTALEYLVRIPDKSRARSEVANLIAKTGQIESLVGVLDAQGVRQPPPSGTSALDQHFAPVEIATLLGEAADRLLRDKDDQQHMEMATMVFMLAGRYADALALLNRLVCPPDKPDSNRQYWLGRTESFHSAYLDPSRPTVVLDTLETDDKGRDLIATSRILLKLNTFFDRFRARQFAEAWKIADTIGLLPTSQADLTAKRSKYKAVDPFYPAFLAAAMDTLYQEHRMIKLDPQSATSAVAQERLRELREKGRLIVGASAGLPSEELESLNQLEALMV